ncbi:hypothetical protein [uncultured Lacinutrix sp.]|uniref:hypothetical protein n=1 Tax=uncultured Lacinutrix sp. TaxID=574032 RepID=UPI002608CA8B|nr:hypothetical protein [uncultured Lacinutrix sp.]
MNHTTSSYTIQKEDIPQLKFSKTEILNTAKKRKLRSHYLERASQLGNLLKTKVKIYFIDSTNKLISVNTTIWAVTSNFVVLKQGITIPKHSIIYIE